MTPQIQVQPEFYNGEAARQKYLAPKGDKFTERTKNRAFAQQKPQEYFLAHHNKLKKEVEEMRALCEMYVTIHRRFRGVTISDQFGYFGTRQETRGRWIEYDADTDGDVHPINIVRPDIRANTAALLQISPSVDVDAANKSAKYAENATRIRRMVDYFGRFAWTEADRNLIFDGIQKEGVWLLEDYREESGDQSVNSPQNNQTFLASYECKSCGSSGKKEIDGELGREMSGQSFSNVPCPSCGADTPGLVQPVTNYGFQEKKVKTYDIKHRLWSGFNFCIDPVGGRKGGIKTARYLRIHEPVSRAEIETAYPQFRFDAPFEFSYPLKCQQALASGNWSNLYSRSVTADMSEFDEFERITDCLHEEMYKNYVSPEDFKWTNGDGVTTFSIARGETMTEAVERSFGKGTKGFRLVFVNDQLVDIPSGECFEPDFRKAFADVHYLRDSASVYSVPNWDVVQLQDDITLMNTLKTETAARNSVNPVWFNSEVFDINDFSQEFIPSKEGVLAEEVDIRNAVMPLPTAKTADSIDKHLEFLLAIRSQVSVVTPAMRGEAQPDQPYAAQRQQLEQSFGVLSSASKSYTQMYLESMKNKIRMAQNCWTSEQFNRVASAFGEEWTEEEIKELCETDLEKDVVFTYVAGSEQPQGNLAKELKFFNALRELQPYIQLGAIKPDVIQQIVKRIDGFGDFDFDLSGLESSDALAQKRFERLSVACKPFEMLPSQQIQMLKQQIVAVQPQQNPETGEIFEQPISQFDLMLEQILLTADVFLSEFEDVEAQALFFVERIKEELAKTRPNYALVESMQEFIRAMQSQAQMQAQEAMMNDPQMQMQMAQNEQTELAETQAKQLEAENADKQTNAQTEQMVLQKAMDEESKENERNFEREKMDRESVERDKDRAAMREKSEA